VTPEPCRRPSAPLGVHSLQHPADSPADCGAVGIGKMRVSLAQIRVRIADGEGSRCAVLPVSASQARTALPLVAVRLENCTTLAASGCSQTVHAMLSPAAAVRSAAVARRAAAP
jgi:hypothetical protein